MSPGTRIRVEPVVNGLLRVVPRGAFPIVVEPVVDLDGTDVGNATPVAPVLVPIIGCNVHPGVIGAIKRVTRRTVRSQLRCWAASCGLNRRSSIKRKQLAQCQHKSDAYNDENEATR